MWLCVLCGGIGLKDNDDDDDDEMMEEDRYNNR